MDARIQEPWCVTGLLTCGAVIAAAALWAARASIPGVGGFELCMAGLLVATAGASAFAVARGSVRARLGIAVACLLVPAAVRAAELLGHVLPYVVWDRGPIANLSALAGVGAAIGVACRWTPARWVAIAAALASMGSAGLNTFPTLTSLDVLTWSHVTAVGFGGVLALVLAGPAMREAFGRGQIWSSPEPVIRALRWTFLTNLVAIPMLLVYAWVQPVVPATADVAVGLAAVLTVAALLSALRKLVGAIVLAAGGASLLVLTAVTAGMAHDGRPVDPWIVSYYAVFWVPAGVVSLVTAGVMIRPLLAVLRRG